MPDVFRPMLAAPTTDEYLQNLKWPMLASPKLDGVRGIVLGGKLLSRTLKPIPNRHTQRLFGQPLLEKLDGELAVGSPTDKNLMQVTMSGVMSEAGEPDVKFYVFDMAHTGPYYERAVMARTMAKSSLDVVWLPQTVIKSYDELRAYEEARLNEGYEGVILRDPLAPYKQGRSTLKQGWMVKVKRFVDSEAEVLDTIELEHNDNEATTDERGYTKRSTHATGKRGAGVLGALFVRDIHTGQEFYIGTGFTAEQRANLWQGRKYLVGKLAKYKHFPIGVKDLPRHPVFLGWRDRRDV